MTKFTNKRFLLLICFSLILLETVFATGASHISSKINPISVNEKGEILCRTRFTKNEQGAHRLMRIEYGFCVISKDSIIQYTTQVIEPDGYPSYDFDAVSEHIAYWDSVFNSCFSLETISIIGYEIIHQYDFDHCNIAPYHVDTSMSIQELEDNKDMKLRDYRQRGLYGALSTNYYETNRVHVLYDFGDVILLQNKKNDYIKNITLGADFDYFNPGMDSNIGYDISEITGVVRIK